MNIKNFVQILLKKHLEAEGHLSDRAVALCDMRYKRKDFQEGYKYALLEVQTLVETFRGEDIKDDNGQTNKFDEEFLEQIKHKA